MKAQWNLILGLLFALIVAIFAVVNVDSVRVNYVFGYTELPLILIIFGSALLGGLVVGMFGIFRQYSLQRRIKKLEKELIDTEKIQTEPNVELESKTDTTDSDKNA